MKRSFTLVLIALVMLSGCSNRPEVNKGEDVQGRDIDLTGVFNTDDASRMAGELVVDCLTRPWLTEWSRDNAAKPVVVVGPTQKNLSEHIDTSMITTAFERQLLNDGRVDLVARQDQRDDIGVEVNWQNLTASAETMKRFGQAYGADVIMLGTMRDVVDRLEGEKMVTYQMNFELIEVESQKKLWIGTSSLKKYITR